MAPLDFVSIPERIESKVLFPHPEGPTIEMNSWLLTSIFKSLIAVIFR